MKPRQKSTKILDQELIKSLSFEQSSDAEIAEICGCSVEELDETFHAVIARGRALGRAALRSAMFKLATQEGSKGGPVAVWLSKNYLGMRDPEKLEPEDSKLDGVEVIDYSNQKSN